MLPNVENSLYGISCYVWWLDQDLYFVKHPTHDFSKDYYTIAQKSPQKQQNTKICLKIPSFFFLPLISSTSSFKLLSVRLLSSFSIRVFLRLEIHSSRSLEDWQLKYRVVPEVVYVIWNQVSWPIIEGCTGWMAMSSAFNWRRSTRLWKIKKII